MGFGKWPLLLALVFLGGIEIFSMPQIYTNQQRSCALLDDGRIKCWGVNRTGQLGLGDVNPRGDDPNEMGENLPTVDLGLERAISLSVGFGHTCALFESGKIKCWGFNGFGQLGLGNVRNWGDNPNEMGENLPFTDLGREKPISLSIGGTHHTCALFKEGRVKCWGNNDYGRLGLGDIEMRGDDPGEMGVNLPYIDLGNDKVVSLVSGFAHTCAQFQSGGIKCWGRNGYGQLGLGDRSDRGDDPSEMGENLPYIDLGEEKVISVACGFDHTCALLESGRAKCWGINKFGQLGLGDTQNRGDNPGEMGQNLDFVDLGDEKALSLIAGYRYTCALLENQRVKCWGGNLVGELGMGHNTSVGGKPNQMGKSLPYLDLGLPILALSPGTESSHSCALLKNNALKCWGSNLYGSLGLGDTQNRGDNLGEMGQNLDFVDIAF